MSDTQPNSLDNIQISSITNTLSMMRETMISIENARAHLPESASLIARLEKQFNTVEEIACDDVKIVLETPHCTAMFKRHVMETGSERLLDILPDDASGSLLMKREITQHLGASHKPSLFRKMITKGLDGGDLIRPLMHISDDRPEIRAYLMDELACQYLARTPSGGSVWGLITSFIIKGPACVADLIRRQYEAFPEEMQKAACRYWKQGHDLNTSLHVLLGAPAEIFREPKANKAVLLQLAESFSSGHGKLRLIQHFGNITENSAHLEDLHNAYMATLDANLTK
jgi:hypothetical protein